MSSFGNTAIELSLFCSPKQLLKIGNYSLLQVTYWATSAYRMTKHIHIFSKSKRQLTQTKKKQKRKQTRYVIDRHCALFRRCAARQRRTEKKRDKVQKSNLDFHLLKNNTCLRRIADETSWMKCSHWPSMGTSLMTVMLVLVVQSMTTSMHAQLFYNIIENWKTKKQKQIRTFIDIVIVVVVERRFKPFACFLRHLYIFVLFCFKKR